MGKKKNHANPERSDNAAVNTETPETEKNAEDPVTENEAEDPKAENEAEDPVTENEAEDPKAENETENPETEETAGTGQKSGKTEEINEESSDERYKRLLADFDNYRTRTEKEKAVRYEMGKEAALLKILPVVDNFENGLSMIPEEQKNAVYDGMEKIYKNLLKILEDQGVKPMDCVGKEFDPNFHNAVMISEAEDQKENVVLKELQKGYMIHDKVLRVAMVTVSK